MIDHKFFLTHGTKLVAATTTEQAAQAARRLLCSDHT